MYWLDAIEKFSNDILDVLADFPINVSECGLGCATTDLLAYLLWFANGYQTLPCDSAFITLVLGAC